MRKQAPFGPMTLSYRNRISPATILLTLIVISIGGAQNPDTLRRYNSLSHFNIDTRNQRKSAIARRGRAIQHTLPLPNRGWE